MPADSQSLAAKFAAVRYRLDEVRRGRAEVPRLLLSGLPRDLRRVTAIPQRKSLFIKAILPLILRANEAISDDRRRLERLLASRAAGRRLARDDKVWLMAMAQAYEVASNDVGELLRRVDGIPPSLALAQSAEESGWGTSRFALAGNAVFGQRTWRAGGGMVPLRRDADKRHEIVAFGGLYNSVAAYMHNLNIHPAYKAFRSRRAEIRARSQEPRGDALVGTLERYSERGRAYIETIRSIMRVNRLAPFDRARLRRERAAGI